MDFLLKLVTLLYKQRCLVLVSQLERYFDQEDKYGKPGLVMLVQLSSQHALYSLLRVLCQGYLEIVLCLLSQHFLLGVQHWCGHSILAINLGFIIEFRTVGTHTV